MGGSITKSINIYPNPVKGSQLTIQFNNLVKGDYSVKIFNHMGQQVHLAQINISNENMTQTLQLPSAIKPGTYNLIITNGGVRFDKTFVVQ